MADRIQDGQLDRLGAVLEWSSSNLLAVDAADEGLATAISAVLFERQRRSELTYEIGRG